MPIHVVCPGCRASLHVHERFAGNRGRCPKCGAEMAVPAAGQSAAEPPARGVTIVAPAGGEEPQAAGSAAPRAPGAATNPYASPGLPVVAAPTNEGWREVSMGLWVVQVAAIVGIVSACVVCAVIDLGLASGPAGPATRSTVSLIVAVTVIGGAGVFASLVMMMTGWLVCQCAPGYRPMGPLSGAIAALTIMLITALAGPVLLASMTRLVSITASDHNRLLRLTVAAVIIIHAIGFACFAWFVKEVARRFHARNVAAQADYYLVYVSIVGAWMLLSTFLTSESNGPPKDDTLRTLNLLFNQLLFLGHLCWLRWLTSLARRAIVVD